MSSRADRIAHTFRKQAGFTLVELLVVMGLFAVTAGLVTINLITPQTTASVSGTVDSLVADLRGQQIKAMAGDSGSATSAQPHGVYIESNRYTLFKGATYSAVDSENVIVPVSGGVQLGTSFSSSQIVFAKGTGEVNGFVSGSNTITVEHSSTGDLTLVTVNRLGVTEVF